MPNKVKQLFTLDLMCLHVTLSDAVRVADRGSVQLGPRDVHSCLSSSFRLSCSRVTAEVVRAGLVTEAPSAGPPVVFTICTQTHQAATHVLRDVKFPPGCASIHKSSTPNLPFHSCDDN